MCFKKANRVILLGYEYLLKKGIAGYALSRVIHRIQSEKNFHVYILLLVYSMVSKFYPQYPAYLLDLRTPPPPPPLLLAIPPSLVGCGNVDQTI